MICNTKGSSDKQSEGVTVRPKRVVSTRLKSRCAASGGASTPEPAALHRSRTRLPTDCSQPIFRLFFHFFLRSNVSYFWNREKLNSMSDFKSDVSLWETSDFVSDVSRVSDISKGRLLSKTGKKNGYPKKIVLSPYFTLFRKNSGW